MLEFIMFSVIVEEH